MRQSLKKEKGNISFLAIAVVILVCFASAAIFDLCQLYVAREQARNLADGVALALAQDLLFFDSVRFDDTMTGLINDSGCKITDLTVTYDEVRVTAGRKVDLVLLDRIIPSLVTVRSGSVAGVTFPWDGNTGLCDSYRFDYRD